MKKTVNPPNRASAATQAVSRETVPADCANLPFSPMRSRFVSYWFLIAFVVVTCGVVSEASAQTITAGDETVGECDCTVTVTVTLDGAVTGGFSVALSTSRFNSTATPVSDYIVDSGTVLEFMGTSGEEQTYTVTIIDDSTVEEDETFSVLIIPRQTGINVSNVGSVSTVTITDNDTAMFDAGTTIDDQIYVIGTKAITPLTLPAARDIDTRLAPLTYTLTQKTSFPAGLTLPPALTFNPAPTDRTLSGELPTDTTAANFDLAYTVTDSGAPSSSATLTFSVRIVHSMTATPNTATTFSLDDVGGSTGNNLRLTLPFGHGVTEVTVGVHDPTNTPASGIAFSGVSMDIAIVGTLTTAATVCLSTAGVPARRIPALYHLPDADWEEIGDDTGTIDNFVCGTTAAFSPFAVG